jgi:signal transduction histidine kinase
MRRLIDVLVGTDDDVPHAPQPSLRNVHALVEQVRAAGLPVELLVEGTPRELPPGVDLSAYRIVQEALTNTMRHAGRARSTVRLRYHRDGLEVEVTDDGSRTGDGTPPGRGLIGMRERVALYGGTLETGRAEGGGFRVRADLPVESVESAHT